MDMKGHILMKNLRSVISSYKEKYFTVRDLLNIYNGNMNILHNNMVNAPNVKEQAKKPDTIQSLTLQISILEEKLELLVRSPGESNVSFSDEQLESVKNEMGISSKSTDEYFIQKLKEMGHKSKATLKAVKLTKTKISNLISFLYRKQKDVLPEDTVLGGTPVED